MTQRRTIWAKLYLQLLNPLTSQADVVKYTDSYYPCALQAAIWEIKYLSKMLKTASNPWQFEKQKPRDQHYALRNTLTHYIHIVEKGYLRYEALKHLRGTDTADLNLTRESKRRALVDNLKSTKYMFLGYLFSK